ncbi:alpha/beta fold hydrolase [Aquihabitans sp. McL0605]|uniref:alpha/beta fold hydrolase n=1 Tax=Aquihabitans sp. McL0605 TaxID=3415671 RepID=UPI003CE9A0CE
MDLEPGWVEIDGMRLRCLDVGPTETADPGLPLLIIPGHTARIEGFLPMIGALAAHHRVVVADLPGSGESDKPVRRYTVAFYRDTLLALLDHLGIDQAIPVGGSLGGNLVLQLGHHRPERFPRLVLWAPGSAWKAKPAVAWVTEHVVGSRLLGHALFWPIVRTQSRFWYSPDHPGRQRELDETFEYYRRVMSPGFLAMYWGMAADQLRRSLFDLAPAIRQPTLLMWGDQDDGAQMGKGVARLHQLLPDNRLLVFPGRRHSLEAECPALLAEQILAGAR